MTMYYKCMEEEIMLPFQKTMNQICDKIFTPQSWQEAHITWIPKEGNDPVLL